MAPPTTPPDYPDQNGGSSASGVTDIFNLPKGVGETQVAVGATKTPGTNLVGASAPGMNTDIFGQANDVGSGRQPDSAALDTIQNILEENIRSSLTDPAKFLQLQSMLFDGGFYGSRTTIPAVGSWSNDTKNALVSALLEAAQVQTAATNKGIPSDTFDEFLKKRAANGKKQREAQKDPRFAQFTDPAAVAQTAQQAAEAAIGRRLTSAELTKFQNHFKASEGNFAAQTIYGSEQNGQPIEVARPDLGGEAQQFVDENMTGEVGEQRGQQFIHALLQLVDVKGA